MIRQNGLPFVTTSSESLTGWRDGRGGMKGAEELVLDYLNTS